MWFVSEPNERERATTNINATRRQSGELHWNWSNTDYKIGMNRVSLAYNQHREKQRRRIV